MILTNIWKSHNCTIFNAHTDVQVKRIQVYVEIISSYLSSRALRDFNARSFKVDKRTHIFCFAQVTVNTERNEIKRKVNR